MNSEIKNYEVIDFRDSYPTLKYIYVMKYNEYLLHLSRFSFEYNNKIYNITLGNRGHYHQCFRFNIDGKNYVCKNVWNGDGDDVRYVIKPTDIRESDIILNSIDFIKNKKELIEYYLDKIDKKNRKNQEFDKFDVKKQELDKNIIIPIKPSYNDIKEKSYKKITKNISNNYYDKYKKQFINNDLNKITAITKNLFDYIKINNTHDNELIIDF